jgi:hypothetical protein
MIAVYIKRYQLQTDPRTVINEAHCQLKAERLAARLGLAFRYQIADDQVELLVKGEATEHMRSFLFQLLEFDTTLYGASIGRTVDLNSDDERALGDVLKNYSPCVL